MQSSGRMTLVLCALIAALLAVNSVALVLIARLRSENQSLRAQVTASQKKSSRQTVPAVPIGTGISTGLRTDNRAERIEKVVEEIWIPSTNDLVSILLGESESGGGLTHLDEEKDGSTTMATLDGKFCRYLNMKDRKVSAFFYFSIDPAFKTGDLSRVMVEIEYFDGAPGTFGIHYDRSKAQGDGNAYVIADHAVRLTGSGIWKTARFQLQNPTFLNSQNGGANFRIWATPAELYVGRVTVARAEVSPR